MWGKTCVKVHCTLKVFVQKCVFIKLGAQKSFLVINTKHAFFMQLAIFASQLCKYFLDESSILPIYYSSANNSFKLVCH